MKPLLILLIATALWSRAAGADQPATPDSDPVAAPPQRIDRTQAPLPDETGTLVRDFDQARNDYLVRRVRLEKALSKATEPQRQALREQLKQLREAQLRAREHLRQQLQELRDGLPDHRELIDQAREKGRDHPRRGD